MEGFSINVKTFELDRVIFRPPSAAPVPDGVASATQIEIAYINDQGMEIPLTFDGPEMRTARTKQGTGIIPPRMSPGGGKPGAPSIAVSFNIYGTKFTPEPNHEHQLFVGTPGNKHEYVEEDDTIKRIHPDYTPATGFLFGIYERVIDEIAKFIHSQKKGTKSGTEPGLATYQKAVETLPIDQIIFRRTHTEGELKGHVVEDANPMKFFKLLNFAAGQPNENLCKFHLSNGEPIPNKFLYGKAFTFLPNIRVRRVFIGMQTSLQTEIYSALVTDIFEEVAAIPSGTARLMRAEQAQHPEKVAEVAEKFRKMMTGTGATSSITLAVPVEEGNTGIKVDSIDTSVIDGIKELDSENNSQNTDSIKLDRRPKLPSKFSKRTDS